MFRRCFRPFWKNNIAMINIMIKSFYIFHRSICFVPINSKIMSSHYYKTLQELQMLSHVTVYRELSQFERNSRECQEAMTGYLILFFRRWQWFWFSHFNHSYTTYCDLTMHCDRTSIHNTILVMFLLFLSSSNFYTPVEDVLRSLFSSVLRLGWPSTQHVVDCLLLLLLLLMMLLLLLLLMMVRMKMIKMLLQFPDILIMITIFLRVNLSIQVTEIT